MTTLWGGQDSIICLYLEITTENILFYSFQFSVIQVICVRTEEASWKTLGLVRFRCRNAAYVYEKTDQTLFRAGILVCHTII